MTTETLDEARERLRPYVERARAFTGWIDFPQTKPIGSPEPWSYARRAKELVHGATSVVDLGTGGGERFAELLQGFGGRALATEEWLVNAPVARDLLSSQGAPVLQAASLHMPFADETFDLVLSRHEDFDPAEVARTLRPGGAFLTQQTWHYWEEVARYIPRMTDFGDHFHRYQHGFADHGMTVTDAREHVILGAFESLGDLVYMLCVAPWEIPNFDPLNRDLEALVAIERDLTTPDGLVLTQGHYIIEAHKPA
jgi:SAM-dependent methyltransferase